MVGRSALRRSGLLGVALIGILPFWVASCEDAPREDCARLRQSLDDVSNGVSAWRCTSTRMERATAISVTTNDDSCASYLESPCFGAFPAEGKFACGPKDCAKGTACRGTTECNLDETFSCVELSEPCSVQNCTCVYTICGSTAHPSCSTGVEGDLWVGCSEYLTCGS